MKLRVQALAYRHKDIKRIGELTGQDTPCCAFFFVSLCLGDEFLAEFSPELHTLTNARYNAPA